VPRLSIVALRVLGGLKCSYPPSARRLAGIDEAAEGPILCPNGEMHLPGLLITIEGVEGAGKTTLAAKLAKYLSLRGCDVVLTEEPGGDAVANQIRRLVLDAGNEITDRSELLLFEAARAQHVDKKIIPALQRGAVVISDRYVDSSVAYQAGARGIDGDTVKMLNDFATHCLRSDITFLLDIPIEAGLAREKGADRVSRESKAFHEEVRKAYLAIAEREQDRFVVIDATLGAEEVLRKASEAVERLLPSVNCDKTAAEQ
jgi:dTMP kinase